METVKKRDRNINSIGPALTFVGPWATVQMEARTVHNAPFNSTLSSRNYPFSCSMRGLCLRVPSVAQKGEHSLQVSTVGSHKLITHQRSTARMEPSKTWVLRQNPGCQDQRAFLSRHVLYLEYVCNILLPLNGLKGQGTRNFWSFVFALILIFARNLNGTILFFSHFSLYSL